MMKFAGMATLIIDALGGEVAWVADELRIDDQKTMGSASPLVARFQIDDFEKHVALTSIDQSAPGYWTGVSWPNERNVVIRSTVESDAVLAHNIHSTMPLPLAVMSYLVGGMAPPPKLFALSDDDGFVVTMMLDSEAGLYLRFSGQWFPLVEDAVDGLGLTEVDHDALDMFDQLDRAGKITHVGAMPKSPTAELVSAAAVTPSITAALGREAVIDVPRLDSAEDLPSAIAFADQTPEFRWWVERRAKAMGLAAEFPWDLS
jgi:hypothetical protein